MPIKMGDQTFDKFEDASKSVQSSKGLDEDSANAYVATIDQKQNKSEEQEEDNKELVTPDAGQIEKEQGDTDLTTPQGSSREAENPNVSEPSAELSTVDPEQDKAEPETTDQDQAKPEKGEDPVLEYKGETYYKVKAIEFEGKIYTQKLTGETHENDIEYEGKPYEEADDKVLQLDDDIYKSEEDLSIAGPPADSTMAITDDEDTVSPSLESIIIKDKGKYKRVRIFEVKATEQEEDDAKINVPDIPNVENPDVQPSEIDEPEVEEPELSDVRAVEKIVIKENGKLKFKTVYTEVIKKKL